jgi:hypothetical protein
LIREDYFDLNDLKNMMFDVSLLHKGKNPFIEKGVAFANEKRKDILFEK